MENESNIKISKVIILTVGILIILYILTPETRTMSFSVEYQDPIYKIDSWQEPVYRTDYYQDPIYETLYSGTIGNYGLTGQTWTITDANSVSTTYTGEGFWGKEYTVRICWGITCNDYYKIQFDKLKLETKITGYETKTKQVIDHYDYKNREIIDHYETKYRTEYKDVTKLRLDWIFG